MTKHSAENDAGIVAILTAERVRQGLSMRDVAAVVGGSASSIHDWEHGVREPTLGSLRAWANALGYQPSLIRVPPPAMLTDAGCHDCCDAWTESGGRECDPTCVSPVPNALIAKFREHNAENDLLPCCRGEGECQAPPDIGPCDPLPDAENGAHEIRWPTDPSRAGCSCGWETDVPLGHSKPNAWLKHRASATAVGGDQ